MFIAALFTMVGKWNNPCLWTDAWVNKVWHLHTMEYHLTLKKKGILAHATTWVNIEKIMLSEINQAHKDKYLMITLTWDN